MKENSDNFYINKRVENNKNIFYILILNYMIYKKNFLSQVIIRADFNEIIKGLDSTFLDDFRNKLDLESVEKKEGTVKTLGLKIDQKDFKEYAEIKVEGLKGQFFINNGADIFSLDYSNINLITKKYDNFNNFFNLYKKGIESLEIIKKDLKFKRLGLRYINKIIIDDLSTIDEMKDYISGGIIFDIKNLLPVNYEGFSLRRNINNYSFSDGVYNLNLKMGVWNSNYPGKIIDNEFILDIDCYIANIIMGYDDIKDRPITMNEHTYNIFDKLTTQKLKDILNE